MQPARATEQAKAFDPTCNRFIVMDTASLTWGIALLVMSAPDARTTGVVARGNGKTTRKQFRSPESSCRVWDAGDHTVETTAAGTAPGRLCQRRPGHQLGKEWIQYRRCPVLAWAFGIDMLTGTDVFGKPCGSVGGILIQRTRHLMPVSLCLP